MVNPVVKSFLTPAPIFCEIRNAAGDITINLAEVSMTTVEIILVGPSVQGLGFLEDMVKTMSRWGGRAAPSSPFAPNSGNDTDPAERATVVFHEASNADSRAGSAEAAPATQLGVLVVDTAAARSIGHQAFSVRVTAPMNSSIRVHSESADVSISGRADLLQARSTSGRIDADQVAGNAVIQTTSGGVSVQRLGADLDLRSVSGKLRVGFVGGNTTVVTTSGDVKFDRAEGDITVRSVSGDVIFSQVCGGRSEIVGVSSEISIGVRSGTRAQVDLISSNGAVNSDFDLSDLLDDAEISIQARTHSGNIRLSSSANVA
ncbi:hypothetical protein EH165_07930 [Nakamurella antarctica]|uniref:Uncharacterized protein n=1 Tax=Nakamurella antarctica TaxID=1902245 RepID=A0A3G8ZL82_9ACTN|nr:DUF4097 family beta strand repeat-containing protein [Nakamurella antarctica]AZI58079.1 hypothetical protein EH165_07930 [Nakamurella antarctica]